LIPKLAKPFTVQDARESVTLRFSDGRVEHYQGLDTAYLFAACDRIEQLEAALQEKEAHFTAYQAKMVGALADLGREMAEKEAECERWKGAFRGAQHAIAQLDVPDAVLDEHILKLQARQWAQRWKGRAKELREQVKEGLEAKRKLAAMDPTERTSALIESCKKLERERDEARRELEFVTQNKPETTEL
jgi:chromosome segregation ATPase